MKPSHQYKGKFHRAKFMENDQSLCSKGLNSLKNTSCDEAINIVNEGKLDNSVLSAITGEQPNYVRPVHSPSIR